MCKPILIGLLLWGLAASAAAQQPLAEEVRSQTVAGIKLFRKGDQLNYPVLRLGQSEQLELHFDDLQQGSRNYFYTFQLCQADWTPANLSTMDFIRGFSQMRLNQFRVASGTLTRYVHYMAMLPQTNMMPSRSGNYLLKVFENSDTSKLLFSKRFIVVDEKASIGVQMQQPFDQRYFLSHQKIVSTVNVKNLDILNPAQEIRLVVMQNFRWDNARVGAQPTFIRGKQYEYSAEDNFVFEGGKEWRWLDLRSFRLQSDRVRRVDYDARPNFVVLRPDTARSPLRYFYFADLNGQWVVGNLEDVNPWWQSDYARVKFTFLPSNPQAFAGSDIYVFGEMSNWQLNANTRLQWNDEAGAYETTQLMKNGYYSYSYVTLPKGSKGGFPSFALTEGNMWQAENRYSVLVYFRPFGARADELIGYTEVSSLNYFNPGQQR